MKPSGWGIALRVLGVLSALIALLGVIGIIGAMATDDYSPGDAVIGALILVVPLIAVAALLFWGARRLDKKATERMLAPAPMQAAASPVGSSFILFGGRRARELEAQLASANGEIQRLHGALQQTTGQRDALQQFFDSHGGQAVWDQAQALEDTRQRTLAKQQEFNGLDAEISSRRRQAEADIRNAIAAKQQELNGLDTEIAERRQRAEEEVRQATAKAWEEANAATRQARADLERLQREAEILNEKLHPQRVQLKLEEAGFVDYDHPAKDSVELGAELQDLRKDVQMAVRNYSAVTSVDETNVPTTKAGRTKLAKDTAKLALTAFNTQVDNIIKAATPRNAEASMRKIYKVAETIERLGDSAKVRITADYVKLRTRELDLAVQHLQAKQIERDLEREHKAELREQAKAERELQAERERLEKEKQHYLNVLKVVQDAGDEEEAARLQEQLVAIEKGINDVEERAANIRAGYVYVISNIGSFGEHMVKIGMTRRLDPMDRVRELGDASVPFQFDVHALFFAEDAVSVEAALHRRFASKRVNRINTRREFFYATPAEVRDVLTDVTGNLLEFTNEPAAEQYRQSQQIAAEEQDNADLGEAGTDGPKVPVLATRRG